jgi:hypothetical protein
MNAEITHPAWCARDHEDAPAWHRGADVVVPPMDRSDLTITMALVSHADFRDVWVELTFSLPAYDPTDTEEDHQHLVVLVQAERLGAELLALCAKAAAS